MSNVGFSTSCLRRSDIPLSERIKFYHSLGADAIELSLPMLDKLKKFKLSEEIIKDIKKYDFVTIHAPFRGVRYGSDKKTKDIIDKLKYLCDQLPIEGIVMHPHIIDDFSFIKNSKLPFLFENMDSRRSFGTQPSHFKELIRNYDFGFVFDVQHTYEHDSSMKLAREIIQAMGKNLKHMHVSGCTKSEKHFPLYMSDNKDAIVEILKLTKNIPKILEGKLLENISQTASEELKFIKSHGN